MIGQNKKLGTVYHSYLENFRVEKAVFLLALAVEVGAVLYIAGGLETLISTLVTENERIGRIQIRVA